MNCVIVDEDAEEQIRSLERQDRITVIDAIEGLPLISGSKMEKLEGHPPVFRVGCEGGFKIIFFRDEDGDYRVVWVRGQENAYAGLDELEDGLESKLQMVKRELLRAVNTQETMPPALRLAS